MNQYPQPSDQSVLPIAEVIDTHIHLFDVANPHRPATHQPAKWLGWSDRLMRWGMKYLGPKAALAFFGEQTDMIRDYLPEHYRRDTQTSGVGQYVHIQAAWQDQQPLDPVGETRWLAALSDGPAAIVGFADLGLGKNVAEVLQAHCSAATQVRGVRHMLAWHSDDRVMNFAHQPKLSQTSSFRAGYEQLADYELSFDAWCFGDQIDEVTDLTAFCPQVPLVLCHGGTPIGIAGSFMGIGATAAARDRIVKQWRESILRLSEQPQAMCKLSGWLMPVVGFGFERRRERPTVAELVDKLGPLVHHLITAFTPQRCMFGSNFPVDRVSADYDKILQAMVRLTADFGSDAQRSIFRDNAAKFYRL